jgi:hypothetical protein
MNASYCCCGKKNSLRETADNLGEEIGIVNGIRSLIFGRISRVEFHPSSHAIAAVKT